MRVFSASVANFKQRRRQSVHWNEENHHDWPESSQLSRKSLEKTFKNRTIIVALMQQLLRADLWAYIIMGDAQIKIFFQTVLEFWGIFQVWLQITSGSEYYVNSFAESQSASTVANILRSAKIYEKFVQQFYQYSSEKYLLLPAFHMLKNWALLCSVLKIWLLSNFVQNDPII